MRPIYQVPRAKSSDAITANSTPDLTLGGQDLSRFETNNINFTMAEFDRDLIVGLQSITATTAKGDATSLLKDGGIQIFIDSTLPYLYLPQTACDAFVAEFGLQVDEITNLYSLNSSARERNIKNNASISFELGNNDSGGETINITFPYEAFDLLYIDESTSDLRNFSYFPIKVPLEADSYTLGRSFLQAAYISVNHEYQNFSVSQAVASGNQPAHVVALPALEASKASPTGPSTPSSTTITVVSQTAGVSGGAIAGIVVGVVVLAALALAGVCVCRRRRSARTIPQDAPDGHAVPTFYANDVHELGEKAGPGMDPPPTGYFALHKDLTAYHEATTGPLSSDENSPGELESPQIGYMPSPALKQAATSDRAAELDRVETPRAELPSGSNSLRMTSRMSEGPSPSLNPQSHGAIPAPSHSQVSRANGPWSDTHYEGVTPVSTRPSLMSADSVSLSNAGSPSLVHHSRDRSSPRFMAMDSIGFQQQSPAHSAGPSIDDSILMAVQHATNPEMPVRNNLPRTVSQDTLVNSNVVPSGRNSPAVERHPQQQIVPDSPADEPFYQTHGLTSLGFPGEWERRDRQQRQSSSDMDRPA